MQSIGDIKIYTFWRVTKQKVHPLEQRAALQDENRDRAEVLIQPGASIDSTDLRGNSQPHIALQEKNNTEVQKYSMQAILASGDAQKNIEERVAYDDPVAFHKASNGQEVEKENLPFLNEMGKGYRSPSALLGRKSGGVFGGKSRLRYMR